MTVSIILLCILCSITVAASDIEDKRFEHGDKKSNYGPCVDIIAPVRLSSLYLTIIILSHDMIDLLIITNECVVHCINFCL